MNVSKDVTVGVTCPSCEDYQLVKSGDIPLCQTIVCLSCETPFDAKQTVVRDVMDMLDKFI